MVQTKSGWGGARPNSGPKPSRKTQIKRFEDKHPDAVEVLLEKLYEAGQRGDRESAVYVIDRIRGRPRQSQDITMQGQFLIATPDQLEMANDKQVEIREAEAKLLTEGEDATEQEEG